MSSPANGTNSGAATTPAAATTPSTPASTPSDPATTPSTTISTPETTSTPPTTLSTTSSTTTPPTTTTPSTSAKTSPTSTPSTSTTSESSTPSSTTSSTLSTTTSSPSITSSSIAQPSTITTSSLTTNSEGSTIWMTVTSTASADSAGSGSSSTSAAGSLQQNGSNPSSGLNDQGKIAVAVVVPIAVIALLVVGGIFLWRKRKQRKDAEEERRKEVEDYIYNPNADPTLPDGTGSSGAYEMKEDASSGYRGWGSTTLAGSTGRKASTTMSGGAAGATYMDGDSPIHGNVSDTRSGEPLMSDGSHSPEGEILGAMGPAASDNRGGNVARGPSNASSSYSAAGRSDGSGENGIGVAYGGGGYYDNYGSNPYENGQQVGGQPVIRDNPARRNTRIENPSHYPQQSAGISQNF